MKWALCRKERSRGPRVGPEGWTAVTCPRWALVLPAALCLRRTPSFAGNAAPHHRGCRQRNLGTSDKQNLETSSPEDANSPKPSVCTKQKSKFIVCI